MAKYFDVTADYLLELEDYSYCVSSNNQLNATLSADPEYAAMVNFWNKMDRGKKMMALGYMERLTEESTKEVL